jgi:hypothetical protein
MKTSSRRAGRTPVIGSGNGPSPGRALTGKMRRNRPFAGRPIVGSNRPIAAVHRTIAEQRDLCRFSDVTGLECRPKLGRPSGVKLGIGFWPSLVARHGAGPQSNGHHGGQRPRKPGQHAFDAVWRIIPAKPHGWSGLALTAFEKLSAEIRRGRSDQRSSPWSTPPRSRPRTSLPRRRRHRLRQARAARSSNRR